MTYRVVELAWRGGLWLITGLTLLFLLLPLVVVIPQSLSASTLLQFPPSSFSFRWYREFLQDPFWIEAFWLSLGLALSVSAASTLLATLIALAARRRGPIIRRLTRALMIAPLVVPMIVSAMALLELALQFGLYGTFLGIFLAQLILAIPFPYLVVDSALRSADIQLEEAAVTLGLPRWRAILQVTLPLMAGSLATAAGFAFIASWDEVLLAQFIGGANLQTLPSLMMQYLTTQVRPTIAAVSATLILLLLLVVILINTFKAIAHRHFGLGRTQSP